MYTGQDARSFAFSYFDAATHHYFENRLENIRHFGLPTPRQGSFEIRDFGLRRIGIYMDDLCLCSHCGRFYLAAEAPYIFDLIRADSRPFARVIKALIASRADTPEFNVQRCSQAAECAERRSRQARQTERDEAIARLESRQEPQPKSVYVAKTGESYKIGIASDVSTRIKALQSACPSAISLVKSWQSANARRSEKLLHERFRNYRLIGEWFHLPCAEVEWLTALERLPELAGGERSP